MRKYIIGSGWYTESIGGYTRKGAGHPFSRSLDFVKIWQDLLFKYCNPASVIITDSDSPIPYPNHDDIQVVKLDKNYQYCGNYFTGWMRGFLNGAMYSWLCEADYVYVEQDCIVLGDWINELQKLAEENNFSKFHPGKKAVWPIQVSLIYIPYEKIMEVISGITNSNNVAPWRDTPEGHRPVDERLLIHCGVEYKPFQFGYGRKRPIDWNDEILYAQHWTKEDIKELRKRENV